MERRELPVAEGEWRELVDHVVADNATVELERDHRPVIRIEPVAPGTAIADLSRIIAGLPRLGDDVTAFARDLKETRRSIPRESTAWDS
jgi:hypothetical protein